MEDQAEKRGRRALKGPSEHAEKSRGDQGLQRGDYQIRNQKRQPFSLSSKPERTEEFANA